MVYYRHIVDRLCSYMQYDVFELPCTACFKGDEKLRHETLVTRFPPVWLQRACWEIICKADERMTFILHKDWKMGD